MHNACRSVQHKAVWDEKYSADDTIQIIQEFALSHALNGGSVGAELAVLIQNGDIRALCDYELDYNSLSPGEAANCAQALAFYQKLDFPKIGYNRKERAKAKFIAAEQACKDTNEFLIMARDGALSMLPRYASVLHAARRKIARILGPVPILSQLKLRFGSGATTLTKKRDASAREYLSAGLACSEGLLPFAARLLEELPMLSSLHAISEDEDSWSVPVQIMDAIADYVRKNAKIDRIIVKEPPLNVLIQVAVGQYLADERLKPAGIDIRDQSINQKLALYGSKTGLVATLDLSNASDTISTELVYELLPWDWAFFLDAMRSKTIWLDGEPIRQEKFSSMGNGFTFPLETLIFWAIASSSTDDGFASVYGDDIIVSTTGADGVINSLRAFGFTVNESKSFVDGPFRESCGKDYHSGIDIRPVFVKGLLSQAGLFRLHNAYVRRHDHERAELVKKFINKDLAIYGPDGYGDGHLIGDWTPKTTRNHKSSGFGGVLFDTYTLKPLRDERYWRKGSRVLPYYSIYMSDHISAFECPDLGRDAQKAFLTKISGVELASLPLPDLVVEDEDGVPQWHKAPSLPGYFGYRKISIYIFG